MRWFPCLICEAWRGQWQVSPRPIQAPPLAPQLETPMQRPPRQPRPQLLWPRAAAHWMSLVSPGSDPPPGVTWTESSGMVSVASLKTSELQSVAWWDWKFPVDMLTRLPEMFCGLSKVYRGSMISVDFQGNRKFRTALQRKNWWCSIPKNSAQLRSTQIPTAFKEFRTWMYLTCSALCFLPQIDVSPKTGDPRYPQFQRIITMFPSKKKETRMVGRPTMSSWT